MNLRQRRAHVWWALAVGVVAGGIAYVADIRLAALIGAGVAAAVYAVRAGAGAVTARRTPTGGTDLARPAEGSAAEPWLSRAEEALRSLREQVPAAEVQDASARTGDELRRAGARAAAVDDAASRIDVPALQVRRTGLVRTVFDTPDTSERKQHAREAQLVSDQLAAYGRLHEVGAALAARLEATAVGLEGLRARGTDTTPRGAADLAEQLDGFRAGLAEAEAAAGQVLGG
jgi:hypothetical protein